MTAPCFEQAGLDFGILYEGERNAGNDVRRVGEEGLFEMLVEKNMAALGKVQFQGHRHDRSAFLQHPQERVPECGRPRERPVSRPALHRAARPADRRGQLKFSKKLGYKVTYHDPCYLGRYNGVYDAPRRVIAATGCELVEMPRHGDRALCCGAGGGRIWMEEGEMTERPSESRIREAVALGEVKDFVVACPKDVTMYRDAVKTTGHEDRLVVKDLIQLVHEAL